MTNSLEGLLRIVVLVGRLFSRVVPHGLKKSVPLSVHAMSTYDV